MSIRASLLVNGEPRAVEVEPDEVLLHTLRERLGLSGTKDACSEGECGACTVLLDGEPVDACLVAALATRGRAVTTVEGIDGGGNVNSDGGGRGGVAPVAAIREALVRAGAIQCGFCTPGFMVTLSALLARDTRPTEAAIRTAIAGNICRCTGYAQIVEAVLSIDHDGVRLADAVAGSGTER